MYQGNLRPTARLVTAGQVDLVVAVVELYRGRVKDPVAQLSADYFRTHHTAVLGILEVNHLDRFMETSTCCLFWAVQVEEERSGMALVRAAAAAAVVPSL